MRLTHVFTAAALLTVAGSARANASPIPGNYIDDFGPVVSDSAPASTSAAPAVSPHSSPIAANYVDDFGSLTPSAPATAPAEVLTAHASPIPSNYVDDFGTTPAATMASQTAVAAGVPGIMDGAMASGEHGCTCNDQ